MRLILATSTAALVLGSACVNTDGSVFIEGALPIDPADECRVDAGGEEFIASGTLDLIQPRGFTAALKVITNLPATFNNQDVSQDGTRSPNYPEYGATDNNVIIFDQATVKSAFIAPDVNNDDGNFDCNAEGECEAKDLDSAVTGSVFNTQTQLNTESAIFVELISAGLAEELQEGLENELATPFDRVRIVSTVALKGTTTGNGDLRDLTTFPFPFPIDLCVGCLTPNQAFCENPAFNANFRARADAEVCFVGQDLAIGDCTCPAGDPADFDDDALFDGTPCP